MSRPVKRALTQRFSRSERQYDAVAVGPAQPRDPDPASVVGHADDLVAENDGELGRIDLAVAQMQIGSAHAARAHVKQQLARPGLRIRQCRRPERLTRCVEHDGAHDCMMTTSRAGLHPGTLDCSLAFWRTWSR